MAGIYIHIPFCKQACHYCDFHFSTSLQNKQALLQALLKEIELQKNYLGDSEINTIYFGGGTPSLLSVQELQQLFKKLGNTFLIAQSPEITLEANPDDLTEEYLHELQKTNVNRLSIGVQSFFDQDLALMNRAHNSDQALSSIKRAQEMGFENITIDLIYGMSSLSDEHWRENLQKAFDSKVMHISAYCLTIEPQTAFGNWLKKGKIKKIDDEKSAFQFEIMLEEMKKNGFVQYEISNFCKDGYYSHHNSNYWLGEKYLGLGPSAHSFDGDRRSWNISNNNKYIKALQDNRLDYEEELLSEAQKYNDYILTSLRTFWGTDMSYIEQKFGEKIKEHFLKQVSRYLSNVHLKMEGDKLLLTNKGKLIADKIASDLFL